MKEKKFILTEQQLDHALRFAAMGGAGILPANSINAELEMIPEEIRKKTLAAACAAACVRTEGPIGAISKILRMAIKDVKDKN